MSPLSLSAKERCYCYRCTGKQRFSCKYPIRERKSLSKLKNRAKDSVPWQFLAMKIAVLLDYCIVNLLISCHTRRPSCSPLRGFRSSKTTERESIEAPGITPAARIVPNQSSQRFGSLLSISNNKSSRWILLLFYFIYTSMTT